MMIPDQSQLLNSLIKDSKLVVFQGANHGLQRDRNADMLKVVRDFL
jgi:pimeloyl-ACP methyl ester carboxylesterase